MAGSQVGVISRQPPDDWQFGPPKDWDLLGDWICADLRDPKEIESATQKWMKSLDRPVDTVVFSAVAYGSERRHPFQDTSLEEWDELYEVNVRSQFVITKCVLPEFATRPKALIISISSDVALGTGPGKVGYSSSKAATYNLFQSLGEELSESGISIVQFIPQGQVDTPGLRKRRPKDFDFSDYISAEAIVEPVLGVIETLGEGRSNDPIIIC
jgi:short-subunit dehydrogenase